MTGNPRHDDPRAESAVATARSGTSGPDTAASEAARAARAARRARQQAAIAQTRRARRMWSSIVGAVSIVALGWWLVSPAGLASSNHRAEPGVSVTESLHEIQAPPVAPTPIFAHYGGLDLHLVVAEEDLTEIGFHQASGDKALPMESYLPDADIAAADGSRGTGRVPAEVDPTDVEPRILGGSVLRMWRANRAGQPDTAADIGAPPGSTVYAPVTGTIIEIKTYELYGKHEDIEIHIQPTGYPEIDLVLIHVEDVQVRLGERVTAGVTPLASVRKLSDRINHQLGTYTVDPGDHVHMQLNRIEAPGRTLPAEES